MLLVAWLSCVLCAWAAWVFSVCFEGLAGLVLGTGCADLQLQRSVRRSSKAVASDSEVSMSACLIDLVFENFCACTCPAVVVTLVLASLSMPVVAAVEREEQLRRAAEYEEPEWVKNSEAVASDSKVGGCSWLGYPVCCLLGLAVSALCV
jgi:hypothetical protein